MGLPTVARRSPSVRSLRGIAAKIARRSLRVARGDGDHGAGNREDDERRDSTRDGDRKRAATRTEKEGESERSDARGELRVLLVGPVQATGGIARYIQELRGRLPESVAVAVYDTAAPPGSGPVRFVRGALGALGDALRFPFHDRPDVLHVHTAEKFSFLRKSVYVLLGRYVWGRPVVLHVHGPTFDRFVAEASAPLRALQRAVFAASARIVVLSPYWEEALSARLPAGKVVVLPNAIDTAEYEPRFDAEVPHIVFVANHVPRKGIGEFAAAVSRVLDGGADCRVSVAGSGPLDGYAEELAGHYPEVSYLGYVSEEEKRELLCEASIYVLPAYAEGLPIGVLEGMAGGNAIVATAVGGVPDLIGESGGRLVPPRDPAALADALEALVAAPEDVREMGRHNAGAVEQYTWERVIPRLTDLYESVAAERS
jgi:glycosyltransferase involved in cell wall biosynthesis